MYCNSQNRMRMRMYHCFTDIKLHQRFASMVSAPDRLSDMKPHVVRLLTPWRRALLLELPQVADSSGVAGPHFVN